MLLLPLNDSRKQLTLNWRNEGKRVATDRKTEALKSALEELRKEAYILSRANS